MFLNYLMQLFILESFVLCDDTLRSEQMNFCTFNRKQPEFNRYSSHLFFPFLATINYFDKTKIYFTLVTV